MRSSHSRRRRKRKRSSEEWEPIVEDREDNQRGEMEEKSLGDT